MKHRLFALYLCSIALLGLIGAALPAPSVQAAPEPAMNESAQRGEKLFLASCAFCHGPTAKGSATGASLIDSSLVRHDKASDLIAPVVRDGRVTKGMPPFPIFDAAQMQDLAAFLHVRIVLTDSVETAGPKGGYQLQHLLTGNAAAGRQFFEGPGGCVKCHSTTKDLAGIAKKYQPTELEAHLLYPRANVAVATVTLASGQTVKGSLLHRDAFYLALVDAEGHYHSWPVASLKLTLDDPMQAHVDLLDRYTNKDVHDVFAYLETLQ